MNAAPSTPRGAIKIDQAVKFYGSGGSRVLAVDHCSLDIAAGEICMIVGPSGCGKTTLLNAIAGFHGLNGGAIHLDGRLLCGPGREKAGIGPDRIVVFQNGALFPWMTTLENVAFGPVVQKTANRVDALEKARRMLADAGLRGYENAYPGETSSGVRRRIEIVRALMNDPAVLLLDEPYRALDSLTKSVMHDALLEAHARNKVTIFFITHDLEEAVFLGRRVVVMTSRPCRPKRIIDVDLPYPRRHDIVGGERFRRLVREATDAVHEEALKAFELGEKEG
ncbi:MAG TPA: ABC transporter ATP-binding protein [Polyangiaceae bacterium]|nr:ABC transporter ATP-binding protein [Polyangiaceae bacterium]